MNIAVWVVEPQHPTCHSTVPAGGAWPAVGVRGGIAQAREGRQPCENCLWGNPPIEVDVANKGPALWGILLPWRQCSAEPRPSILGFSLQSFASVKCTRFLNHLQC